MLVLTRRPDETLVINDNIRFTVLSVQGNQVRIGIEAPSDVIVLREEIIDRANRSTIAIDGGEPAQEIEHGAKKADIDHPGTLGRHGILGLRRRHR